MADEYTDRQLTCVQCETEFTFSADDQAYHARMQFENEPKRCKSCRAARKQNVGGGSSAPREFHEAVCADCGGVARVPFKPRGDKPVYCSNCFAKQQQS